MLPRPLELDCVPAALSMEGGSAAVGAVELCPRLHPVDAYALREGQCLPGCRWTRPVCSGRGWRVA
eukprot:scaffold49115_cov62-Phaeocystis_antarctica.AAC.2